MNETLKDKIMAVSVPRETDSKETLNQVSTVVKESEFSKALDAAKLVSLSEAAKDNKFVEEFKSDIKQAASESAKLEKDKVKLDRSYVELNDKYIQTKKELEQYTQRENKWTNREKAREYHYNGLKNIMQFARIDAPAAIPLMYFLAGLLLIPYIAWYLVLGPLGTLVAGTKDSNRPRVVKNAIYTIMLVALVAGLVLGVYALGHYLFMWW